MDKSSVQRTYEFGEFRFDAGPLILSRAGVDIPLAPKAALTLLTLLDRYDEVVSKDELIEAVWPDSFVEESNLFRYVHVLRKTLGEDADGKPYLETLHRRGYRFNGPVRAVQKSPDGHYAWVVENPNGPGVNIETQSGRLYLLKDPDGEDSNRSARQTLKPLEQPLPDPAGTEIHPRRFDVLRNERPVEPSRSPRLRFGLIAASSFLLLALAAISFYLLFSDSNASGSEAIVQANSSAPLTRPAVRLYWEMSEEEKATLLSDGYRRIAWLLGDEPVDPDEKALFFIKTEVERYVSRRDSLAQTPFQEGIRTVYGRASQFAPVIDREYTARNVPPVIGLYQAMIESEFHDCLPSPIYCGDSPHCDGPVGLFQFTRRTGLKYDLPPAARCDSNRQIIAAARYMSDLLKQFRPDGSATLGLLAFNDGEEATRAYLDELAKQGISGRDFWTILKSQENFPEPVSDAGIEYVPRFFAAAIIGENPEAFGLSTPPLTSLK